MQFAVLDTYYPSFLSELYGRRPELARLAYREQHDALMATCFGTADAYSRALGARGHQAEEIVMNNEALQLRWLAERSRVAGAALRVASRHAAPLARRADVLGRIVAAQVEALSADVVYALDVGWLAAEHCERFRRDGRLLVGQVASPWPGDEVISRHDLMFSSFPHFVQRFRALGVDAEYMPLAFHEPVIERVRAEHVDASPESERQHAVTFVGGVDPAVHPGGTEVLEHLARASPLEVWGYGADRLPPGSPIRGRHRGPAWGLAMYRVLATSQIVVNRHIEAAEGFANNMRLFEATGMGAMVLTEEAPNLGDLFEPGVEIATYSSRDDLLEKVSHYVANPEDRVRIAAAGQRRTLSDHTYTSRIEQINAAIAARRGS